MRRCEIPVVWRNGSSVQAKQNSSAIYLKIAAERLLLSPHIFQMSQLCHSVQCVRVCVVKKYKSNEKKSNEGKVLGFIV